MCDEAQRLGQDLAVLVSYDERMLAAAGELGIPTSSPRQAPLDRRGALWGLD
jgi:hypothetical protein